MTGRPPSVNLPQFIRAARRGEIPSGDVVWALLDAVVVVPSALNNADTDNAFIPLVVSRDGVDFIVAFTTLESATSAAALAPRVVSLRGRELISSIDGGLGLVIDPEGDGFELSPATLATIRSNI